VLAEIILTSKEKTSQLIDSQSMTFRSDNLVENIINNAR
jgi:hypothetical protein